MEEKSQRKLLLHCWCSLENSGLASFLWWRHVKAYDLVGYYYSQMYYAYRRAWIAWKSKWCLNSSILLSNFPIKLNIWETKMFIVFKWICTVWIRAIRGPPILRMDYAPWPSVYCMRKMWVSLKYTTFFVIKPYFWTTIGPQDLCTIYLDKYIYYLCLTCFILPEQQAR